MWNSEFCRFVGDKSNLLRICVIFNSPQQTDWRIDFLLHSPIRQHCEHWQLGGRQTVDHWVLKPRCIRAFDHWYSSNSHTQHACTHYDFPSTSLSCYPSMNMKAADQCRHMRFNTEHVLLLHCNVVYWGCCQGGKKSTVGFFLYDLWLYLWLILQ